VPTRLILIFAFLLQVGCASVPAAKQDTAQLPKASELQASAAQCDFRAFEPHMTEGLRGSFGEVLEFSESLLAYKDEFSALVKKRFGVEPTLGEDGELVFSGPADPESGLTQSIKISMTADSSSECAILKSYAQGHGSADFASNCPKHRAEGALLGYRAIDGRCRLDASLPHGIPSHLLHMLNIFEAAHGADLVSLRSSQDPDFNVFAAEHGSRVMGMIQLLRSEVSVLEKFYDYLQSGKAAKGELEMGVWPSEKLDQAIAKSKAILKETGEPFDAIIPEFNSLRVQVRDDEGSITAGLTDVDLVRLLAWEGSLFAAADPASSWMDYFLANDLARRLDASHFALVTQVREGLARAKAAK